MEKDWQCILTTKEEYQAIIARDLLEEESINAVIINQKDTTYTSFGDIELYVADEDVERALKIIEHL